MGAKVVGASRLRRKLKRMPDEITLELRTVIAEKAEVVLDDMRQRAPVSDAQKSGGDRGHIRDALEVRISKDGLRARIGLMGKKVLSVFFYGRYLEHGTRYMSAEPFIFPGWQANKNNVRKAVVDATKKALATVARSNPSDV